MINKEQLKKFIKEHKLIEEYIDLDTQLTPNGFDLTAQEVFEFTEAGSVDFSNKERVVPPCTSIVPQKINPGDNFGWWRLSQGTYKVRTNEIVNLPNDLTACAFPRSSLLRVGAFVQNGVWDAGFCGRSEFVLVVGNPEGLKLKQNARIIQLIFFPVSETEGYKGIYQNL